MSQPRIFIHLENEQVAVALLKLPALKKFIQVRSSRHSDWVSQLRDSACDAAILEINNLSDQHLKTIRDEGLLHNLDFMLLSQGMPNPQLDSLLVQYAGFHYREPYAFEHIGATVEDFFHNARQVQAEGEQVVLSELEQFGRLLGSAPCMRKLYQNIRKVAGHDAHVFISGESGAGKELVASTVHAASARSQQPFVALNCGALPAELIDSELFGHVKGAFTGALKNHPGVFAQADGGTLFLDEITEMPLEQQVKLLRVLESGEYRAVGATTPQHADIRVIAATNRDPRQAVQQGCFREDLYFRLAQFPMRVPPLRERGHDIEGLARHFLAYRNAQEGTCKSIHPLAMARICQHSWPGNVRELKHSLERAYILADDLILAEHIIIESEACSEGLPIAPGMALKDLEQVHIERTLRANNGNKTSSAEQLGISVKTLYNKLDKYQS